MRATPTLPPIEGKITEALILRQTCGDGSLGDTKIGIATTGGLGGFALIVEVTVKGRPTVYVEYDGAPIVEAVARAIEAAT